MYSKQVTRLEIEYRVQIHFINVSNNRSIRILITININTITMKASKEQNAYFLINKTKMVTIISTVSHQRHLEGYNAYKRSVLKSKDI